MIKFLVKATSLIGLILSATGCVAVYNSQVRPGTVQYPSEIKHMVFVNFRTESDVKYNFSNRSTYYWVKEFSLENEKTHAVKSFPLLWVFNVNEPFLRIPNQPNATITLPVLVSLEPGDYRVKDIDLECLAGASGNGYGVKPKGSILRFTVPDKDFCSLGTICIEIKTKPPEERRFFDSFDGAEGISNIYASTRPVSPPEKDFAVQSFPFLKNLNLTP